MTVNINLQLAMAISDYQNIDFKWKILITTVQLTAKFTLACAIHAYVVQFYSSDLLELACHTRVRPLVLHSSQS